MNPFLASSMVNLLVIFSNSLSYTASTCKLAKTKSDTYIKNKVQTVNRHSRRCSFLGGSKNPNVIRDIKTLFALCMLCWINETKTNLFVPGALVLKLKKQNHRLADQHFHSEGQEDCRASRVQNFREELLYYCFCQNEPCWTTNRTTSAL